jgi:hypothetical protein
MRFDHAHLHLLNIIESHLFQLQRADMVRIPRHEGVLEKRRIIL